MLSSLTRSLADSEAECVAARIANPADNVLSKTSTTCHKLLFNKECYYPTPLFFKFIREKSQQLAEVGELPYTTQAPPPKYKTLYTKLGEPFQINLTQTYLDGKHTPSEYMITILSSTSDTRKQFTYGNMEAAKKILWPALMRSRKNYKNDKTFMKDCVTPACYTLLESTYTHILQTPKQTESVPVISPPVIETVTVPIVEIPKLTVVDNTIEDVNIESEPQILETINDVKSIVKIPAVPKKKKQSAKKKKEKPIKKEENLDEILQELAQLPYTQTKYTITPKSIFQNFDDYARWCTTNRAFTTHINKQPRTEYGIEQMDGASTDNLENVSSVTSSKNLTYVDERPIDSTALHTNTNSSSTDKQHDIAEDEWSIKSVLEREWPLLDFEWKVTASTTDNIINIGLPKIITDNTECMITRQLMFFAFMRGGIKIRIQINGTKFHCGRLICYFKPLSWNDDTVDNSSGVVCYPHCMLDASISNTAIIEIPYTHLLSYFSQEHNTMYNDSINSLGSLIIRPFNKLNAAEKASQSLHGQVYASLLNPSVHLPTKAIQKFSYGNGYMQGLEGFLKKQAGGLVSSGLGIADKMTGGLVTGAGDAICNLLGLRDYPTDPMSAAPIINRTVAPLCHGAGLDRSIRLALTQESQTNTGSDITGGTDCDFNIRTLCQMPSLLKTFSWREIDGMGAKLYDFPVTPVFIDDSMISTDGTQRIAIYSPTMLAYVSRAFCLWRGTLKIKLQVIATQFHSGRLAIVFDPHGTTDINFKDFSNNKSHNIVIMDLEEKQELEIDLPYFAVKPWLRCDRLRGHKNLDPSYKSKSYLDCDITGIVRIFVLNPLVKPDNVPNDIDVNLFISAGKDFELAVPCPVAPLSFRRGPTGIQYPNIPKYAYCKTATNLTCKYEREILGIYWQGKRLTEYGFLTPVTPWYKSTAKVNTTDVINFLYLCSKIKYWLETADANCKTFVDSLATYTVGGTLLYRIDENTKSTKHETDQILKTVKDIDIDSLKPELDNISQITNKINAQIQTVNSNVNSLKTTVSPLSGQIKSVNDLAATILGDVKDIEPKINTIQTTTENTKQQLVRMRPELTTVKETVSKIKPDTDNIKDSSQQILGDIVKVQNKINEIENHQETFEQNFNTVITRVDQIPVVYENTLTTLQKLGDMNITVGSIGSLVSHTVRDIGAINQNTKAITNQVQKTLKEGQHYNYNEYGVKTTEVWYDPKKEAAQEEEEMMREQGLENYTTTREDESSVVITKGQNTSEVAPQTVSENAMNLQTVLRRYYPLFVSEEIKNTVDFTVITIPVTPSFVPNDQDTTIVSGVNRQYDVNNLAWFSRLYNYNRGSLRYKVVVSSPGSDVYVWHDPIDARDFTFTTGFSHDHISQRLSYAAITASTGTQQGLEVELPYASGFNQLCHSHVSSRNDLRSQVGTFYIAVRNINEPITVSVFIATGDDFLFNVLKAPPVVYEPFQFRYIDDPEDEPVKFAELYHNLHHQSRTDQIPGSFVFNANADGQFGFCKIPDAPAKEQMLNYEEPEELMQEQMLGLFGETQSQVKDIVTDYHNTVKPAIVNFNELVNETREHTIPAFLGHGKKFHQDLCNTHDTMKEYLPKMAESLEHFNATSIKAQQVMDSITDTAGQVKVAFSYAEWFGKTLLISALWLNLISLYKKFTYTTLLNVITFTCMMFDVQTTKIIQYIWKQLTETYEGFRPKATDGAMTEQGFVDVFFEYKDRVQIGIAAIVTIIYCSLFGELPKWSKVKKIIKETVSKDQDIPTEQGSSDFLKSIHFSNLGFKAIDNAYNFFKDWIERIMDYILGTECRDVQIAKAFEEKSKDIIEWIDKVAELDDEDFYQQALCDLDVHNQYYKLVDQGNEYTKWLMQEGVSRNVSAVIRDTNKRLMDMIKRIQSIRPGHGYRYAPFVVMFHGETSTGKSNMMHKITDIVRDQLRIPYYNSVYAVPSKDQYLSGYEGQAIVEWDDHLQNTEQDPMVGEFVQWCSNTDVRVNMADLEHKGAFFTSKAIIATTNVGYGKINTIRDMDAYRRRRNIVVGVKFAEGWNKERMVNAPRDDTYSHATFNILNPSREDDIWEHNLTWQQVQDYIAAAHLRWDNKQKEMIEDYNRTRPSMRIPKGVVLTAAEQGVQVNIEEGLNEEQQIDAELFQINFEEQPIEIQQTYLQQCKTQISEKSRRYYDLLKRKLSLTKNTLMSTAQNFYDNHPNFTNTVTAVGMLMGTGILMKTIYETFSNTQELIPTQIIRAEGASAYDNTPNVIKHLVKAEGASAYDSNPSVPKHLVKAEEGTKQTSTHKPYSSPPLITESMIEQGCDDPQAIMMGRTKIHPLMATVGWEDGPGQLQCVSVGGKVILVPHHFFRKAKAGDFFWFLRGSARILVEYTPERLQRIRDKDACLYFVGPQFDSRRKILNCFVSEKDLSIISKEVPAVLVGTLENGTLIEKACIAKGDTHLEYRGGDTKVPTYKQTGWTYSINTLVGECGSVLIACTPRLPPPAKIIGIHTAGYVNKTGGFSIVLTREMIEETLAKLEAKFGQSVLGCGIPQQVSQDPIAFEQCKVIPEGAYSYYGTMDPKFCPSQPDKTQLRKTPFHDELYEVVKEPALLKPKGDTRPLNKALTKYGKLTRPFKIKHIKAVRASILNDLMKLKADLPYEPTSLETAIFGEPAIKYCDPLNFNSSPGWPYQCMSESKGQKGKAYLFDINARTVQNDYLKKQIIDRENNLTLGQRTPSIWRDCLKDELRTLEKVRAGKTRLFTIAPVDFTILTRKYFLAFEQAFYKGHSTFFSAVGINPESFEWTTAYNRLRQYGDKCCAGDFGGFDGTLMADLMYEAGEVIDDWYKLKGETDPNATIVRRTLIDEMIHTYQLVLNCVYKTHQGNPSGNPLTVIINTIVNAFYMRLSWMEIMEESNPALATMTAYTANVIEEMYGDDNRLVIKAEVIEYFNQITISNQLAKHGIEYTDEQKSKALVPYKPLLETSFLKRRYRIDEEIGKEIVLPQMDVDTITSLTNWMRSNLCAEEQLQANQRAALGFAFFHGRSFYDNFNFKFQQAMREHDLMPLSITYDELLGLFLGDVYNETINFIETIDIKF